MNGVVPQGSKLGIPLFLVIINKLMTRNPTPKFMDNTPLHETRPGLL